MHRCFISILLIWSLILMSSFYLHFLGVLFVLIPLWWDRMQSVIPIFLYLLGLVLHSDMVKFGKTFLGFWEERITLHCLNRIFCRCLLDMFGLWFHLLFYVSAHPFLLIYYYLHPNHSFPSLLFSQVFYPTCPLPPSSSEVFIQKRAASHRY